MIQFIKDSTKFVQMHNGKNVGSTTKLGILMTISKEQPVLHKLGDYTKLMQSYIATGKQLIAENRLDTLKYFRIYDISELDIKEINALVQMYSPELLQRLYLTKLKNQNYEDAVIVE